ncbi:MAG: iron-containing alcohol dehydrogenase [Rhodospirillales bacterium]
MEFGFDIIAAPGALKSLPGVLRGFAVRKPFVIAGPGIMGSAAFDAFKAVMPHDMIATVFVDAPTEPDEEAVISALALYRATRADGLIVYGARATLDFGKAVLLSVSQGGPLHKYAAADPEEIHSDQPPFIAIPMPHDIQEGVREPASIVLRGGRTVVLDSPHLTPKKVILDLTLLENL